MLIPVQAAAEPSMRAILCLRGPRSEDLLQLREESERGQAGRGRISQREREREALEVKEDLEAETKRLRK